MSKAPEICRYCQGTGDGPGAPCGFCVEGKPLDTQEDWDRTWGKVFDDIRKMEEEWIKEGKKRRNDQQRRS